MRSFTVARRKGLELTLRLGQDFLFLATPGLILNDSSISNAQRGRLVG